ncbi:hypothetical protein MJI47_30390, partial [Salmonella enterica subsp. enterica serovar Kentucky]|nr:hypothetical protein [Salmonella enterica subsp. enterica serovar Kentucky]
QAKDVWRDRLGNVVARYGSDKSDALRLMIFAHMDEVGFMVRKPTFILGNIDADARYVTVEVQHGGTKEVLTATKGATGIWSVT